MKKSRKELRERRHIRLRQKIRGSAERPRMCIVVSNRCIRVQFIDDDSARTIAVLSSDGLDQGPAVKNVEAAGRLGAAAGRLALSKGISRVVCDRAGRPYHGRVKALADAAREAGLSF